MEAERKYNEQSWELKMKNDRLDYLERLYKVKHDIEYREQRRVIDSLINKVYEH